MSNLPGTSSPASRLSLDTNESDDKTLPIAPDDTGLCKMCWDFKCDPLLRRPMNGGCCSSLFESAEKGCYTCKILQRAIVGLYDIKCLRNTRFNFTVPDNQGNREGNLHAKLNIWDVTGSRISDGIDMYRIADGPCPWEFFQVKSHVPSNTGSSTSLSWAQEQMNQCLSEHTGCGIESDTPLLPTRVVDVSPPSTLDNDIIKVVETHGARGKYLALSHCWGDPARMTTKLTAHTIKEYQNGIPFDSLPQTFRDAVTFTRRMKTELKTQYIWIDSLCIIQRDYDRDSREDRELSDHDWTQEAARMCSIYEHSYLTLAGASAAACTDGFFFKPTTLDIEGSDIKDEYRIFARREINHIASMFPLMKRGWVAQECLLSPRTLFFGESELLWQCRGYKTCQCTAGPGGGLSSFPEYVKLPKVNKLRECSTQSDLKKRWYRLVSNYSKTSLTYQADKLTAIDGIVQYMSPLRNCKYLAGLWSDSLALDLLWSIDTLGRESKRTIQTEPPPRKTWWLIEHLVDNCPAEAILVNRFEDTRSDAGDQAPGNELRLRGVLVPSTLKTVRKTLNGKIAYYPDYDGQETDPKPDIRVFCLRVLNSGKEYYSLVLLCVDKVKGLYERIGLLKFNGQNGLDTPPDYRGPRLSPQVEWLPPWWEVCKDWKSDETTITLV